MNYDFVLDSTGSIALSRLPDKDMALWTGDVLLGILGPTSRSLPLHAIANNMTSIERFGLTLASNDFAVKHTVNADRFLEFYGGPDALIDQLRAMIGPNKWALYSIAISSARRVTANFGLVIPNEFQGQRFVIYCNGKAMDGASFTLDPYLAISHWFMSEAGVLGCRAVFDDPPITDFLEFSISFPDHEDAALAGKFLPLFNYTNPALLEGVPDVARIRRISGAMANKNSFLNGGMTAAQRIATLIDRYHSQFGSPKRPSSAHRAQRIARSAASRTSRRILDWGVGCGRVARHFADRPDMSISGIDIDQDNLEWCRSNLRGRYETVGLFPPTPFDDSSFDIIYSCSVLSHLTEEAAHAWLAELARVLASDGIALLSFNGSTNLASYLGRRPLEIRRALGKGLFDRDINHDLDGFIPSKDYYRASFAKTSWWTSVFAQHFDIVAIEPSVVSGYQDIAVLRKR